MRVRLVRTRIRQIRPRKYCPGVEQYGISQPMVPPTYTAFNYQSEMSAMLGGSVYTGPFNANYLTQLQISNYNYVWDLSYLSTYRVSVPVIHCAVMWIIITLIPRVPTLRMRNIVKKHLRLLHFVVRIRIQINVLPFVKMIHSASANRHVRDLMHLHRRALTPRRCPLVMCISIHRLFTANMSCSGSAMYLHTEPMSIL